MEEHTDGDVCCPFEEIEILIQPTTATASVPLQAPKYLTGDTNGSGAGTVVQADADCIYIGGKYKLAWKRVTALQVDHTTKTWHISTVPINDDHHENAINQNPRTPSITKNTKKNKDSGGCYYQVTAHVGVDMRTGRPPVAWPAFARWVERKWHKKQRKKARQEAKALEEAQTMTASSSKASRNRATARSGGYSSKASQFLLKNARNIKEWDSDDDDVFNRQPHKELLHKRRQQQKQQHGDEEEDEQEFDDKDDDNNDHHSGEEMMDGDEEEEESFPAQPAANKKQKLRKLKMKNMRRMDNDDSDDEDEHLFRGDHDEHAASPPDVTTPMAKRVVTPGTTVAAIRSKATLLDDEDEMELDDIHKAAKATTKKSAKNITKGSPAASSITNFFAPRAVAAATTTTATSAAPAKTQLQSSKGEKDEDNEEEKGNSRSTPSLLEEEEEEYTKNDTPAASKKKPAVDFFAPRTKSTAVAAAENEEEEVPTQRYDDDEDDDGNNADEEKDMMISSSSSSIKKRRTHKAATTATPKHKASFSSAASMLAFESAKKLELENADDPIVDFDDEDAIMSSPSFNKTTTTALVAGTSPLASRLSGQKRRLFPRKKGYYGTKPPSTKLTTATSTTATRALEQAEHQSPRRNLYAGMGSTISSSASSKSSSYFKKPSTASLSVGSPLSPIRARPLLTTTSPTSPAAASSNNADAEAATPRPKWVGLRNLGNTCYMNASLQMLYSIPSFMDALTPFRPGHSLVNMFCQTYQNVIHPAPGKEGIAATARVLKFIVDAKTDKFKGYQQRDAHEFLGHLLDQVQEEIESPSSSTSTTSASGNNNNPDEDETKDGGSKDDGRSAPSSGASSSSNNKKQQQTVLPTDDFFRLNVEVCLQCKSCGYSRTKEEMYRYISVDIDDETNSKKPTVQSCLEHFFRPEDREVNCEKCENGTAATQTLRILSRPKALLVHLKRFRVVERPVTRISNSTNTSTDQKYDAAAGPPEMELSFQKNRAQVELTPSLSLNSFLSSKKTKEQDESNVVGALPSTKKYALRSIVHHIGNTANSGHYTADALRYKPSKEEGEEASPSSAKDDDDPIVLEEPQWVSYDDGATMETTLDDVRGSVKNQRTAYMLLYCTV